MVSISKYHIWYMHSVISTLIFIQYNNEMRYCIHDYSLVLNSYCNKKDKKRDD